MQIAAVHGPETEEMIDRTRPPLAHFLLFTVVNRNFDVHHHINPQTTEEEHVWELELELLSNPVPAQLQHTGDIGHIYTVYFSLLTAFTSDLCWKRYQVWCSKDRLRAHFCQEVNVWKIQLYLLMFPVSVVLLLVGCLSASFIHTAGGVRGCLMGFLQYAAARQLLLQTFLLHHDHLWLQWLLCPT